MCKTGLPFQVEDPAYVKKKSNLFMAIISVKCKKSLKNRHGKTDKLGAPSPGHRVHTWSPLHSQEVSYPRVAEN